MLRYLLRRALFGAMALLLLTVLVFLFVQLIVPGDFVTIYGLGMSPAAKAEWRRELGLDRRLATQYLDWLGGLLRGDLGWSYADYPVWDGVRSSLQATAVVFLPGMAIAYLLGGWLGRATAWRGPGLLSEGSALGAVAFYAFFPPALVFALERGLGEGLGWFAASPTLFLAAFDRRFPDLEFEALMPPMAYTLLLTLAAALLVGALLRRWLRLRLPALHVAVIAGAAWVGSWFALGFGPPALLALQRAAIPMFAFTLLTAGEMMAVTRTAVTDTLREPFVFTARAKGLPPRLVRDRHAARTALLPVLSRLVISLPYLLAGLVIIERAANWGGLGSYLFHSAFGQDIPAVLGTLFLVGVTSLAGRLVLEAAHAALDPRLRALPGRGM
jgi:peptide/nickel transport system permease protein